MKKLLSVILSIVLATGNFFVYAEEPDNPDDANTENETTEIISDSSEEQEEISETENKEITVIFEKNAEDANGEMENQQFVVGEKRCLNENAFSRDGYDFSGWNTSCDGDGVSFSNGQEAEFDESLTLYAQWEEMIGQQVETVPEESITIENELLYSSASDFTVTYNSGYTATITGYTGTSTTVDIPATFSKSGKTYRVTEIANKAFQEKTSIVSVTMPDTVTKIGEYAFNKCTSLKNITLSKNLVEIGQFAFKRTAIEHLTIPASVTVMSNIFEVGQRSVYIIEPVTDPLKTITIEEGMTTIPNEAFARAGSLETVVLPSTLTTICDQAFYNNFYLTNINLPSSLTTIGELAFFEGGKGDLVIPAGVTSIGRGAFSRNQYSSITVNSGNKNYYSKDGVLYDKATNELLAYPGLSERVEFTVPSNVKSIGYSAFGFAQGVKTIIIPEGVTSIGATAFYYTKIKSIYIPKTVTSIAESAFYNALGKNEIYYGGTEEQWNQFNWGNYASDMNKITVHFEASPDDVHNFQMTGWEWKDDYSEAYAVLTCTNDPNHIEKRSAELSETVPTVTCEESGIKTITASFTYNGQEYTDTKEVTVEALGHKYKLSGWNWSSDYESAEVTLICENNNSHILKGDAVITKTVTPATATTNGTKQYEALAPLDGKAYTSKKTVTIPADSSFKISNDEITVYKNETETLLYTGDKNVVWSSDNEQVAQVDENGEVTGIASGTATITMTSADGDYIAAAAVTVKSRIESITVEATEFTINRYDLIEPTITISPSDADINDVYLESGNTTIAGIYGLKIRGIKSGNTTVTVKSRNSNVSVVLSVTVKTPVTSISLSTNSLSIKKGQTSKLKATVSPSDADDTTVVWESSNERIATVDQSGEITALKAGNAGIIARTADGNVRAVCQVYVKVYATSIELSDESLVLFNGGGYKTLSVTLYPEDSNDTVHFSISDTSVASVSSYGIVKPKKNGTATITAKSYNGKATDTCIVYVVTPVSSLSLNKTAIDMEVGDEDAITATVLPADASDPNVYWKSSDESIVTVDNGRLTAISPGTVTITANTYSDLYNNYRSATCEVTVYPKAEQISLDETALSMTRGEFKVLTATVLPENALNKEIIWESSNESVAILTEGGVLAAGAGEAELTAVLENDHNITAKVSITVWDEVASVNVEPLYLYAGEEEGGYFNVQILPETAHQDYSISEVSDSTICNYNENNQFFGLKRGSCTVTFTTPEGKTGQGMVYVIDREAEENLRLFKNYILKNGVKVNESQEMYGGADYALIAKMSTIYYFYGYNSKTDQLVFSSSAIESGLKYQYYLLSYDIKTQEIQTCKYKLAINGTYAQGTAVNPVAYTIDPENLPTFTVTVSDSALSGVLSNEKCQTAMLAAMKSLDAYMLMNYMFNFRDLGFSSWYTEGFPYLNQIELDKHDIELDVGFKEKLNVTAYGEDGRQYAYKWNSSDPSVASVDTQGNVTAKAPGEAIITVTSVESNKKDSCKVSVTDTVGIENVVLSENELIIKTNQTYTLSATVLPDNATHKEVSWSSSNESVATVDEYGVISAVGKGTAYITATSADESKQATCKVTVIVPVERISLYYETLKLMSGEYIYPSYTIYPSNANNKKVVWASSNPEVVTVSSDGKVQAVSTGRAIISVTAEDGGYKAECDVFVSDYTTDAGILTATLGSRSLLPGQEISVKITNKLTSLSPSFINLSFTNSDTGEEYTVSCERINSTNEYYMTEVTSSLMSLGEYKLTRIYYLDYIGIIITDLYTDESPYHQQIPEDLRSISFYMGNHPITSMNIVTKNMNLFTGESDRIDVTITPDTASALDLNWISSNIGVAIVNKAGKVTGNSIGNATITAFTQDGQIYDTCNVTVLRSDYNLSVESNNGKTIPGSGIYKANSVVELSAPEPDEGYRFVGWRTSEDLEMTGGTTLKDRNISFLMPVKDITVRAVYVDESASGILELTVNSLGPNDVNVVALYPGDANKELIRQEIINGTTTADYVLSQQSRNGTKQVFSAEGLAPGNYVLAVYKKGYLISLNDYEIDGSEQVDTVSLRALGDVDRNGQITVSDIIKIRDIILEVTGVTGDDAIAADVNQDNAINVSDIILVRDRILEIVGEDYQKKS